MCSECPAALAADVRSAFPALVDHHRDLVYGIARRWTSDHHDAEDLTQETFLRAFRALNGFPPERRAMLRTRGWLARIALNLARDRARRMAPAGAESSPIAEPVEDRARGPEAAADRREAAREWRRRLAALPREQRLAVELRHVEGLSYPEMAQALARPVGTIKSDVHRGVARLRRALEAELTAAVDAEPALDPHRTARIQLGSMPPRARQDGCSDERKVVTR